MYQDQHVDKYQTTKVKTFKIKTAGHNFITPKIRKYFVKKKFKMHF